MPTHLLRIVFCRALIAAGVAGSVLFGAAEAQANGEATAPATPAPPAPSTPAAAASTMTTANIQELNDAIITLLGKLDNFIQCDRVNLVECRVRQLKQLNAEVESGVIKPIDVSPAQLTTLTDAITSLVRLSATTDTLEVAIKNLVTENLDKKHDKAIVRRVNEIIDFINKEKTLAANRDVRKAVGELDVLVKGLLAPTSRRINVVQAWFGDLDAIEGYPPYDAAILSGQRFCNALRAIRTACQGRTSCLEPPVDPAKRFPITAEALCGFDPVQYADKRWKGVLIGYQCLALPTDEWHRLELEPHAYMATQTMSRTDIKQARKKVRKTADLKSLPGVGAPPQTSAAELQEKAALQERAGAKTTVEVKTTETYPIYWAVLRRDNHLPAIRCQAQLAD